MSVLTGTGLLRSRGNQKPESVGSAKLGAQCENFGLEITASSEE